ncbi:hypothetical protein [Xanthomonas oryzae]|uniref:hypothetical protein n=1 Tax=Xanthomonas oryzae TaxID=347 RepID=UPI003D17AB3D
MEDQAGNRLRQPGLFQGLAQFCGGEVTVVVQVDGVAYAREQRAARGRLCFGFQSGLLVGFGLLGGDHVACVQRFWRSAVGFDELETRPLPRRAEGDLGMILLPGPAHGAVAVDLAHIHFPPARAVRFGRDLFQCLDRGDADEARLRSVGLAGL